MNDATVSFAKNIQKKEKTPSLFVKIITALNDSYNSFMRVSDCMVLWTVRVCVVMLFCKCIT